MNKERDERNYVVIKYKDGKKDYMTRDIFNDLNEKGKLNNMEKIIGRGLSLDEAEAILNGSVKK